MSKLFREGDAPSRDAEFVLTWHPEVGTVEEVPIGRPITVGGVRGKLELSTRVAGHLVSVDGPWKGFRLDGDETGGIGDAVRKATENPGKAFEVGQ